jgi:uncharacterized membrane protein (DUF441 family)
MSYPFEPTLKKKLREVFFTIITSKKALATIAGILVTFAAKRGIMIPESQVNEILAMLISYIVGQGIADAGKSIGASRN